MTCEQPSLSSSHRRALSARLQGIERELDAIEAILDGSRPGTVFPPFTGDIPPKAAERLRMWIVAMREALGLAMRQLDLDHQPVSAWAGIRAHLSRIWVDLEESRTKRLLAYGALPPEQDRVTTDAIDRLFELFNSLRADATDSTETEA